MDFPATRRLPFCERHPRCWPLLRWLLPSLAILHHLFYLVSHSRITYDEMLQTGAAWSHLAGQGLALRTAAVDDLAAVSTTPLLAAFPPAYALIMSGLNRLGLEMGFSDFLLKAFAVILFFLAWTMILETMRDAAGRKTTVILWLFWGIAVSPVMAPGWTGHTTGMLALALFSLNLAAAAWVAASLARGAGGGHQPPLARELVAALFGGMAMGLAMAMRYDTLPQGIIMPAALCAMAFFGGGRRPQLIGLAMVNGLGAAVVCTSFLLCNWLSFGLILPASAQARGWFPENLLRLIPFPLHALGLLAPSFFGSRAVTREISLPPAVPDGAIAWGIALLVLAVFALACRVMLLRVRPGEASGQPQAYGEDVALRFVLLVGLATLAVNCGFLAWLSMTTKLVAWSGGWIYLSELRYFAVSLVFIFFGLALFAGKPEVAAGIAGGRGLRFVVLALMAGAFFWVGGWRLALDWRQFTRPDDFDYGLAAPLGRDQILVRAFARMEQENAAMKLPVVVVAAKDDLLSRGQAKALGAVDAPVAVVGQGLVLNASRPVAVLAVLRQADTAVAIPWFADRYGAVTVATSAKGAILFFVIAP